MACKLYYQYGNITFYLGTFRNRKKAEWYWGAIKVSLEDKLGTDLTPVYVETGKGRGK